MTQPNNGVKDAEARLQQARTELTSAIDAGAPRESLAAAATSVHAARADFHAALNKQAPAASAVLPSLLNGHLFSAAGEALAMRGVTSAQRQVAVCLSGGGTRAAACSMGALRALRQLGLLDRVAYLSTVSGGGWAGSLYMYAPHSDDDLLGPVLPDADVSQLRWESGEAPYNLSALGQYAIGRFCTQLGWDTLVDAAISLYWDYGHKLAFHAYWPRLIGRMVLAPYGLGDLPDANGAPTRYYTLDSSWFEVAVQKLNPTIAPSNFYFAKAKRPYWVASATLNAPGPNPTAYPFWASQFDVGIYPKFAGCGIGGSDLGGGSIDPFTFGALSPQECSGSTFTVATPPGQFALSDAIGTSSAAFGDELFARLPSWLEDIVGDMTPVYPYWPPSKPAQVAASYDISDGGDLDNSAICGLLGWSPANSIVSFVNTDVPITINGNSSPADVNGVQMDSSIPALFGLMWDATSHKYRSITFADGPNSAFGNLVSGLRAAIAQGGAAVSKVATNTVPNNHFGVAGGRAVEVLFVFNHKATTFYDALEWEIHAGLDFQFPLVTFPYFDTLRDLNLTAQAVNLLADAMAWSVSTNASAVRGMFGNPT
jgi:Patatin-like phospholipase